MTHERNGNKRWQLLLARLGSGSIRPTFWNSTSDQLQTEDREGILQKDKWLPARAVLRPVTVTL